MISLLIVIAIVLPVVYLAYNKKLINRLSIVLAFLVTSLIGAGLDHTLGLYLKSWYYDHITYLSSVYYSIIPLAWGVFGIWVLSLYRLLYSRAGQVVALALTTLIISGISEVLGHYRSIWTYSVPLWVIVIGWPYLIISIVIVTNVLQAKIGHKPTVWEVSQTTKEVT